jgi:hypothetical protein
VLLPDDTGPPLSGDELGLCAASAVADFAMEQEGPDADGHPEADALARHQGSGQEDPEISHTVEQDGLGRQEAHDQAHAAGLARCLSVQSM